MFLKTDLFYLHGLCNCLSVRLLEYIIPLSGLVSVIFLTNKAIINLIKKGEVKSESIRKSYETINGIARINDAILSNLKLNKLDRTENYMKIIGIILGTEGIKLKNRATSSFLAFLNKQGNIFEGNIIDNRNGALIVDNETIKINVNSNVAVTTGMGYVQFSNWTDMADSIEKYQNNFD